MHVRTLLALAPLCALAACSSTSTHDEMPARITGPLPYDGTVLVTLGVSDVAAAKKWYGDVLGCRVVYELPEHNWAEVATPTGGALIGLAQHGGPSGNGGSSFAFGVSDIDAAMKRLVAHKVTLEGDVMEIPDVVKLLSFRDPFGNSLMLYQPLLEHHPAK